MGVIIAVTSSNAAVGKSAICVGIALALGGLGKRVIVSDISNTSGSTAAILGLSSKIVYGKAYVICGNCVN